MTVSQEPPHFASFGPDSISANTRSPSKGRATRSLAIGILAWIVVAAAMMSIFRGTPIAVVASVLLILTTPGAGVICARGLGRTPNEVVTAVLVSVGWATVVGVGSAWTQWQNPVGQFCLLVAPGIVGAVIGVATHTHPAVEQSSLRTPADDETIHRPAAVGEGATGRKQLGLAVGFGTIGVSLASFVLALWQAHGQHISDLGLLPVLGPLFVIAVAAAVAAVAIGCSLRPVPPLLVLFGLAVLGGMFTITPYLFTTNFLSGWNYKHLGVVDLIASGNELDNLRDMFQQWPGFFALGAEVQTLSDVPPQAYANWAQAVFVLVAALGLYSAARQLYPSDRATAALSVALYLSTGWAGQMYYAPQSFGFAIAMLILAQFIPLLLSMKREPVRLTWFRRSLEWATTGLPQKRPLSPAAAGTLATTIVLGFLAIVFSHQLTPFMLLLQFAPFVLAGWVRGGWRLGYILFAVLALAYLYLHRFALGVDSVFTGFSVSNITGTVSTVTSQAQQFASRVARIVALLVWFGAALSAATYWRRFGVIAIPVLLAAMPLVTFLVGNYGGEAIYRVWLFSAPWCAVVIAQRVCDLARLRGSAVIAVAVVSGAMFFASAQATVFGMFPMLSVSRDEISASTWLLGQTQPNSTFVLAMTQFPARLNRDYVEHNLTSSINDPALSDYPEFSGTGLSDVSAADLATFVRTAWGETSYLIISRSMEAQNAYYQNVAPGALAALTKKLRNSAEWATAYHNDDVDVFALRV